MDKLSIDDLSADCIRAFLAYLEEVRHCSVSTRNQRLAAIHALARFIGERSPEHIDWCSQIRAAPFKRSGKASLSYLEKTELDALLRGHQISVPNRGAGIAVLLFLYNSGASQRSDPCDDRRLAARIRGRRIVKLHGKGGKVRMCPLWTKTMAELIPLTHEQTRFSSVILELPG